MIRLRTYQDQGVGLIRHAYGQLQKRSVLYVLSTGGGKTRLFAHMAHGAHRKGKRVWTMCHRVELVDQIADALADTDTPFGYIAAGYPETEHQTSVVMVQTVIHRLDKVRPPDFIIVDEAHHARASTYEKILNKWPHVKILGVTATPIRTSGEGLGAMFEHMIVGPPMRWLIDNQYLSPYRLFAPPTVDTSGLRKRKGEVDEDEAEALVNQRAITGSSIAHYREHAHNWPALGFTASVRHAESVAEMYRNAGYAAVALHGKLDRGLRKEIVRDYKRGAIKMLTSCGVISEGFDVPGARYGSYLNPTQSLAKFMQENGRLMRFEPGKIALLADHVGNTDMFGAPDQERDWSLEDGEVKGSQKSPSLRVCPKCWTSNPPTAKKCAPPCDYEFPVEPRTIKEIEGELAERDLEKLREQFRQKGEKNAARTLEDLLRIEKKMGHKRGWAVRVFDAREKKAAKEAAAKAAAEALAPQQQALPV